jgi:predicted ATPase/DNA-binding SARP family transcriptional activator
MFFLRLLDGFEFAPAPKKRLSKPATRLLALTALRGQLSRTEIAETIWPIAEDPHKLFYLRRTLTELRHAWPDSATPVEIGPTTIGLQPEAVDSDIQVWRAALASGQIEEAVRIFGRGLLPHWREDWVEPSRIDLELEHLEGLRTFGRSAEDQGDHSRAEWARREIVRRNPGDEAGWQCLLRDAARRLGATATARILEECERQLLLHTGHGASAQTRLIAKGSRSERPMRLAPLPPRPDAALGRDQAVTEILDAMARNRLVTVVGAGGVGKTFLAGHVAHHFAETGADVAWVELASIGDGRSIGPAIALACGVGPSSEASHWDTFMEAIASRRAVIVVDNAEHLREELAPLVAELLRRAPDARILVTSRSPLHLFEESVYRLSSLREDPARDLLAHRLRLAGAPLISPDELSEVSRLLDGIPLAIELCAAQLAFIPASDLSAKIRSLLVLDAQGNNRSPRHTTMRAAISVGVEPLSDWQRRGLSRLAIFVGGFDLAAAETVGGLTPIQLRGLVERSLVEFDGRRYRLLEPMRLYFAERNESEGTDSALRKEYAEYFAALAGRISIDPYPYDTDPRRFSQMRARLVPDDRNFALAHSILEETYGTMSELAIKIRLVRIWHRIVDAASDEAVGWARQATLVEIPDSPLGASWALTVATYSGWTLRFETEGALLMRAEMMRSVGVSPGLKAWFHQARAAHAFHKLNGAGALDEYHAALTALEGSGRDSDRRHVQALIAQLMLEKGCFSGAEEVLDSLLPEALRAEDVRAAAIGLRAKSYMPTVPKAERRALVERAADLQRRVGHWGEYHTRIRMARLAEEDCNLELARRDLLSALDVATIAFNGEIGLYQAQAHCLQLLSRVESRMGDDAKAQESASRSVRLAAFLGRPSYLHTCLISAGCVIAQAGRLSAACALRDYVERAIAKESFPSTPILQELLRELRGLTLQGSDGDRLGAHLGLAEAMALLDESQ